MSKHLKGMWVAVNGSIFTEDEFKTKTQLNSAGKMLEQRTAIAFNVGDEVAKYIVNLHNNQIVEQRQLAAIDLVGRKCFS